MSRLYRVEIRVRARDTSAEELAAIDAAISPFLHDGGDVDEYETGSTAPLIVGEGDITLTGGRTELEAHEAIRATLQGRAVETRWWYLEREPDEVYRSGPEDEDGE